MISLPTHLAALETPVPIVDLDRLDRNLDRMAAYAARHALALRPHIKTHKSPRVAREQMRRGAVGLTCATVREAEVMAPVATDLLLAYPILGASKLRRLMALPSQVRITVALDSLVAVDQLAAAARAHDRPVRVYVEIDAGMRRVGVGSPEEAVALAAAVVARPPLEYAGITFYPGHIREALEEQDESLARLRATLREFVVALERAGLPPRVVSGGSTPTAWRTHELTEVTELRPGTYVYHDRTSAATGSCTWDECALTILATVVSTAVPGQAIIDAGSKALGREPVRGATGEGFGALLDRPEVTVCRMSEEHGILDLGRTDWRPAVGDLVRVVPNHVCVAVHLFDVVYGVRGEQVEECWPVAARGR
jgi:D-serine deaminase-like pyridoxal phosphate-dependent protein